MDPKTILFLCEDNAARSLMAEAFVNSAGRRHFRAFSAGFNPAKTADADALDVIAQAGIRARGLHPKPWQKFAGPEGLVFDFAVQIGDLDHPELKPLRGNSRLLHWPIPDRPLGAALGGTRKAELIDLFAEIRQMAESILLRPARPPAIKRRVKEDREAAASLCP